MQGGSRPVSAVESFRACAVTRSAGSVTAADMGGTLTCQAGDFYHPTWPGPVENLAEIAIEVTTSAFEV